MHQGLVQVYQELMEQITQEAVEAVVDIEETETHILADLEVRV
jgi:hypothetical protein